VLRVVDHGVQVIALRGDQVSGVYGVQVATDPTPFLSTIVATSAALVAIIGGLLVARFVGLDSDQRGSRKVLADAVERLEVARGRARGAWQNVLRWDASDFFRTRAIVKAVLDNGVVSPDELMRIASWSHAPDELAPFAAEVAEEAKRARETLTGRIGSLDLFWEDYRRRRHDLPEIRWPRVWGHVYDSIVKQLAEAEEARRKAAPPKGPFESLAAGLDTRQLVNPSMIRAAAAPSTDYRATEARRHDELIASHERASQQVEDYEAELVRLRQEHAEIVRPDARLWWGIAILIIFTALGVALPLWVMSQGPHDLAPVRWVFYPFAGSLAALIIYIVVYLVQLTRADRRENQSPWSCVLGARIKMWSG